MFEDVTIGELVQAKENTRQASRGKNDEFLKPGMAVFIRTVTFYYTGTIRFVSDKFIALDGAAWIADTGRFSEALETGVLSEVEPYPDWVTVSLGAVVDISPWKHDLPKVKK